LKTNGWLVIEDIPERALPLWEVVAALLPDAFACKLLQDNGSLAFAVQRQASPANAFDEGRAAAYGNLGREDQTHGDLTQAEASLLVHLQLYDALGRKDDVAAVYGYLGMVYQAHGDLAHAEAMHKKALKFCEALGRKEGVAAAYANLGLAYQTRGDLAQASSMYKNAIALFQQLGSAPQARRVQALLDSLI
jgi:tetratricopeptide (TPR) repeat protein